MKQSIRISLLLIALLLSAAWAAAGSAPDTDAQSAESDEKVQSADHARTLRVQLGGTVEELALDNYLVGVLRAEMPASFEGEALRAQAVAARTYTLCKMAQGENENHPDADTCDDIACCKAYRSAQEAAADWGAAAGKYEDKLRAAVTDTDGEVLTYNGEPILAVFFSSAAGHTQNAAAVWQSDLPYLQSVDSPENETLVPNYFSTVRLTAAEVRERLLAAYPDAQLPHEASALLGGLTYNSAGYVATAQLGSLTLRGNDLRTLLSLRSPCFTAQAEGDELVFHVTGYGHGVGMSQYGANTMASSGMGYEAILAHYYPGTKIEKG